MSAIEDLDRARPLFEGQLPFRVIVGTNEARNCELTLRFLEGTRVSNI